MNEYPDHETYKKLYERFYEGRSVEDFFDLAGSMKDKKVLDLCGGDGRLSLEAVGRGAREAWLVEKERPMISNAAWASSRVVVCPQRLETALEYFLKAELRFDCALCRQAVNYWLNEETAKPLADVLVRGGIFVFNTFNRKPPTKPAVKEYELNGVRFVEASWLAGDIVHHVQIREGMPCHANSFKWLSPEYLENILTLSFLITLKKEGGTSLYRCVKK